VSATLAQCGVSQAAVDKIDGALKALVEGAALNSALVIDHSGYIVARRGQIEHVRPEELASIAAGVFASFEMIIRARELTMDFHTKGVDNIHFVRLNTQMLLLSLFGQSCDVATVRTKARATAKSISKVLGQTQTVQVKLGSVHFITSKLDEMFKDVL